MIFMLWKVLTLLKKPPIIKVMGRKPFTKEYLIKKLQEAAVILGRTPSQRELDGDKYRNVKKLDGFPSRGAYRHFFGTFANAQIAAGLPPSMRGSGHPNRARYRGIICDTKPTRNYLSLRFKVLHRDGFKCQYCGRTPQDGTKLHVDHITPRSAGGLTKIENLITSCQECNRGKTDKLLTNLPKKKAS